MSITEKLKLETHSQHRKIEQIPQMKRLFADDYALSEYRAHLEKMYVFFSAMENKSSVVLNDDNLNDFFLQRSKKNWLETDLKSFGLTDTEIVNLPPCQPPNFINNLNQCFGAYYVLEGSSLGGQVILKQLQQRFSTDVSDKLHFYQGYGAETLPKWRQFCEQINQHFAVANVSDTEEVLTAAKTTFTALGDWIMTT